MKTIKLFTLAVAFLVCNTAFAQFTNTNSSNRSNNNNSSWSSSQVFYKGFFETGYALGVGDYDFNRLDISTSHGVQISNIFLGLGAGVKYFHDEEVTGIPFFTEFRVNFLKSKVSPFAGFKMGYTFGDDVKGFMMSPAFGCHFGLNDNVGLTLSLGYDYQKTEVYFIDYYYYYVSKENCGAIVFKIGIEF